MRQLFLKRFVPCQLPIIMLWWWFCWQNRINIRHQQLESWNKIVSNISFMQMLIANKLWLFQGCVPIQQIFDIQYHPLAIFDVSIWLIFIAGIWQYLRLTWCCFISFIFYSDWQALLDPVHNSSRQTCYCPDDTEGEGLFLVAWQVAKVLCINNRHEIISLDWSLLLFSSLPLDCNDRTRALFMETWNKHTHMQHNHMVNITSSMIYSSHNNGDCNLDWSHVGLWMPSKLYSCHCLEMPRIESRTLISGI